MPDHEPLADAHAEDRGTTAEEPRVVAAPPRRGAPSPARDFDASRVPLFIIDRTGQVVGLNRAAETFYGVTEAESVGRPSTDLLTTSFLGDTSTADAVTAINERSHWQGRVVHHLRDGSAHEVDVTGIGVGQDGERLTYVWAAPVARVGEGAGGADVELEARFRTFFEHWPEALLATGADGTVLELNHAAATLFDVPRWDLLGEPISSLLEPDAVPSPDAQSGPPGTRQGTARRPAGDSFPYESTAVRVTFGDRPVDFIAVRDRTQRLRLDAALATLTDLARLHEAVERVDAVAADALEIVQRALSADRAAIGVLTAEGRINWVAAHEMDEFIAAVRDVPSREQVPWLPRILASGRAEFVDRTAPGHEQSSVSALADRMGMAAYAVMPLRAGEQLTGAMGVVWSRSAPPAARDVDLLNTIGRLVGMAIANAGLHETLNSRQRALDESESRYRALFEAAPDAIVIEDKDGRVLDANPAAAALYGYSLEQLVGMPATQLTVLGPDAVARTIETVRGSGAGVMRGVERRADGTTFPSELQFAAVTIGGEERYIVTVRDLTERERFQAELLQAQKMEALGQLVSGVAHELNNPLSAIIAFSQLLRRDAALPSSLAHDAELLMQEADRTRRIVQNLLDFARQRPPARQPTSVRSLVDRTAELQAYGLGSANIRLDVAIPEDTPPINVDPSQLQQVVLNLTMNAIQAISGEGRPGRIEVSARAIDRDGDQHVEIRFTDDGPGVVPEARDRLFEPFYTTKAVGEGTGLGLSVSYGIVASHGGRLWYEPAPGRGSTFVIDLPAAQRPPTGSQAQPVRGQAGQRLGGVVLVVDDESSIRAFLDRALSKAGHEVTLAADGTEALDSLGRLTFDAILCDHRMTGLDGLQVYERGVAAKPELAGRFVLMSGDVLNPALQTFAEEHGVRLLPKPFDIDTVLDAVDEVVTGRDREP